MNKKTKIIIGVVAVVAIAGGIYYFSKRKKTNGEAPPIGGGIIPSKPKLKWEFTDNTFTSTGKSTSNLGFVGTTKPPFKVGDWVSVQQFAGAKYPQYNGKTLVQDIAQKDGKWFIDVDRKREGDSPVNGGVITST